LRYSPRGSPAAAQAAPEQSFQFERSGYFVADRRDHTADKPVLQRCLDLAPQCRQGVRAQVFGAGHGRRVQHQRLQGRRIGRGHAGQVRRIALLRGAQGREVARGQIPPIGPDRRQGRRDAGAAQLQQTWPRARGKCSGNGLVQALGQGRCVRIGQA